MINKNDYYKTALELLEKFYDSSLQNIDGIKLKNELSKGQHMFLRDDIITGNTILKICYDPEINIDIFGGLTEIPEDYLDGCELPEKIIIPDNIKVIGIGAFANTNIKEVKLPDGLEEICDYAFAECWDLESINITPKIKYSLLSFYNCPLEASIYGREVEFDEYLCSKGGAAISTNNLFDKTKLSKLFDASIEFINLDPENYMDTVEDIIADHYSNINKALEKQDFYFGGDDGFFGGSDSDDTISVHIPEYDNGTIVPGQVYGNFTGDSITIDPKESDIVIIDKIKEFYAQTPGDL